MGLRVASLLLFSLLDSPSASTQHLFVPIPQTIAYDPAKALLGKELFVDPALSKDGTVACVNCHTFKSGADTRVYSLGVSYQRGDANAPTVFNSVFNFRQMWNGRSKNLQEQVALPIHNPKEMGMSREKVTAYLSSNPRYAFRFQKIYGHPPTFADAADAIAEFEKTLITPESRFDRFLRGEISLHFMEQKGYMLFKRLGCILCHNGINLGGNSFQKFGLVRPYPWSPKNPDRYAITHQEADKNLYKVPTLRNIALTAPYLHDGSAATLEEAIKKMVTYNLGFKLKDREINALVAFLKTLTGKSPETLRKRP